MDNTQKPSEHVVLELRAREAWSQRDYSLARQLAGQAAEAADQHEDEKAWWDLVFLQAKCLKREGLIQDASSTIETLRFHPLTLRDPARSAQFSTFLADALMGTGSLESATSEGRRAAEVSDSSTGNPELRIRSRHALISALAESDKIDDAWKKCRQLAGLLTPHTGPEMLGKSYWVFGNVAYLLGDSRSGKEYHAQAAVFLTRFNDLDLWARFNRASAALRLAGGIVEPETLECIERAELTAQIIGQNERETLELSLTRASWLFQTGQFDAAAKRLLPIRQSSSLLGTQTAAEAHSLLGQALVRSGHPLQGLFELEKSRELYKQAGAPLREARTHTLLDEIQNATDS